MNTKYSSLVCPHSQCLFYWSCYSHSTRLLSSLSNTCPYRTLLPVFQSHISQPENNHLHCIATQTIYLLISVMWKSHCQMWNIHINFSVLINTAVDEAHSMVWPTHQISVEQSTFALTHMRTEFISTLQETLLWQAISMHNLCKVQSLFHGKSQQSTNYKLLVLLTLLFLGFKTRCPNHSFCMSAGLTPCETVCFNFSEQSRENSTTLKSAMTIRCLALPYLSNRKHGAELTGPGLGGTAQRHCLLCSPRW